MFPWVFNWSPVVHWPLSGPVRQLIAPETDWFFGRIRPEQGDARIEQRVVEDVASYGRQIGLISELLVELAGDAELSAQGRETLDRLKGIAKQVDEVKQDEQRQRRERLKQELQALQTHDAEDFRRLVAEISGG